MEHPKGMIFCLKQFYKYTRNVLKLQFEQVVS